MAKQCIVKGCLNKSDQGSFVGNLCLPCYETLRTGEVHPTNITFIGQLKRAAYLFMEGDSWMRLRQNAYNRMVAGEVPISDPTSLATFELHKAIVKELDKLPVAEGGRLL